MQAHARATVAVSRALQDFAKALQDTRTAGAACINLETYITESGVTLGVLSEAGLLTLLAKLAKSPVSFCSKTLLRCTAVCCSKACLPLLQPGISRGPRCIAWPHQRVGLYVICKFVQSLMIVMDHSFEVAAASQHALAEHTAQVCEECV